MGQTYTEILKVSWAFWVVPGRVNQVPKVQFLHESLNLTDGQETGTHVVNGGDPETKKYTFYSLVLQLHLHLSHFCDC